MLSRERTKKGRTGQPVTYGRYEVGGSGGHSGPGGGRGVPERFGEEGPHHSIAGEKQSATQQPQRDMELRKRIQVALRNLQPSTQPGQKHQRAWSHSAHSHVTE